MLLELFALASLHQSILSRDAASCNFAVDTACMRFMVLVREYRTNCQGPCGKYSLAMQTSQAHRVAAYMAASMMSRTSGTYDEYMNVFSSDLEAMTPLPHDSCVLDLLTLGYSRCDTSGSQASGGDNITATTVLPAKVGLGYEDSDLWDWRPCLGTLRLHRK
ncbi:hypothetical protein C8Q73DRAFT_405945 [Cubamyces lactineus]|nr:hypothetical protein C8Q73DRAFT_405945 [Cubamyces lactineus]